MVDPGPEECAWRNAYGAWWEAATTGNWDAEHDLRMTAYNAWLDLPDEVKDRAWHRYSMTNRAGG